MPPDRLAELQRQRELVREHLAWLDREIASAIGNRPSPIPSTPPAAKRPTNLPVVEGVQISETPPLSDPAEAAANARRGCLVLAATVAILGALALVAIYYFGYRDRPLI